MTEQRIFKIQRKLTDAGMNETEIAECISLIEQNRYTELNRLLKKHRLPTKENDKDSAENGPPFYTAQHTKGEQSICLSI